MSRRIPDELHALRGEPGHRKKSRRGHRVKAAAPSADRLAPPEHLRPDARRAWCQVIRDTRAIGTVTTLDLALLECWAAAVGDFAEAERSLAKEGMIILDRDKNARRNPWLLVRNKAVEQITRLSGEFGFSPASRSRVGRAVAAVDLAAGTDTDAEVAEFEAFLAAGRA